MELKVESKIGTIQASHEKVYAFFSDFRNLSRMIPPDKVKNLQVSPDECSFETAETGSGGLKIVSREPCKTIKMQWFGTQQNNFFFWIQLLEPVPYQTKIKLTIKAEMNMMMKMMAQKPLKTFLDTLVEQISKMTF